METAKHSFRPGKLATYPGGPAGLKAKSRWDNETAAESSRQDHDAVQESRFSYSSLLRRQETRKHSFRVPDLPAIPSSDSEESNEFNTRIRIPSSVERRAIISEHGDRPRNSRRTSFLEYILPFSPHPTENQIKEQALAAFPNEQVYQPVDHFAIDRDEEESSYGESIDIRDARFEFRTSRRASSADLPSELEYLRRHKEEASMNRRHYLTTRGARSPLAARWSLKNAGKIANLGEGRDAGSPLSPLTQLRQLASPPMLGSDLTFPQSLTPETSICERPNGVYENRSSLSSLSGLWSASPRSSAHHDVGGLWNGTCKPDRNSTHGAATLLTGLITPRHDMEDATGLSDEPSKAQAPLHRNTQLDVQSLGNDSHHSEYVNEEFNDAFVTQIYDYLSLGYPSIARYYDYELSKVSGVSVASLRADDLIVDAKGHVGVHDFSNNGATNGACMRWTALRLYIQEWVRQQPQMLEAGRYRDPWGVRERKGSWAV
ncbi:uncharacterized protein DSM5745_09688 [Aspergillus mulundensis]|uniref:Uncharacterized protein n=1 Tax=Aspergillus mulundensis TaxID=1810919 RepID=A0A3D8QR74_9EURO|nr:Uncharacterized protein DSM5745_09688 [Aspergillus mulundensis]RDW64277.1 Uncharacterized protein DSM5745_09688 [Aspergillus mulundensis]